jgi:hypothetical protein
MPRKHEAKANCQDNFSIWAKIPPASVAESSERNVRKNIPAPLAA